MKAMKIGLVDLDTSHPGNWLPILRSSGHQVIGVYDSGSVYSEGYAGKFAREHGIDTVYESLEAMADAVDLAIIHSCNWDSHIARALPFVKAGKALYIDKPMAGNLRDIQQFAQWEEQGIRITGGSSLRYCLEVAQWKEQHAAGDNIVFAVAGCSVDEFNYGIHAYSLLQGIFGAGMKSVRYLGSHIQRQFEIVWHDGDRGYLSVGETKGHLPFYATVVTETKVSHLPIDHKRLYAEMLPKVLPYLAGEAEAPIAIADLLEVEMAAIAAKQSLLENGRTVLLTELSLNDPGYDGSAFAVAYKQQKMNAK
jgi:hypothetical protein